MEANMVRGFLIAFLALAATQALASPDVCASDETEMQCCVGWSDLQTARHFGVVDISHAEAAGLIATNREWKVVAGTLLSQCGTAHRKTLARRARKASSS
jgi:hypothetical protein